MALILFYIAYEDWKCRRIADRSVLAVVGISLFSVLCYPEINGLERVVGSLLISLPLFFLAVIVPGSIGGGDIKLMAAAGFGLGIAGIWHAFVLAVFSSGIYVIILLTAHRAEKSTEIALGPFLCLGILAVWLLEM